MDVDNVSVNSTTPVSFPASPSSQATVTNVGPEAVYYKSESNVSSTSNDGKLASGESLAYSSGVRWFISASTSRLFASYIPNASTDLATQAELESVDTQLDNLAIFNVKDYGAKGDGATDDATAIQKALDAANTAGGGLVFLPKGTYIVGKTLEVDNFVTLAAAGARLSTLKLGKEAKTSILKSKRHNLGGATSGTEYCSIFDLGFDANVAENPGSVAVLVDLDGIRPVVERIHLKDGYKNLKSMMSRPVSEGTNKIEDGLFKSIEMTGSTSVGFELTGPHDSEVDHVIMRCSDGIGFLIAGTTMNLMNCHVYGKSTNGFSAGGGHTFTSCIAEGCTKAHVLFTGDSNRWYGGWVFAAGAEDSKIGFEFAISAFSSQIIGVRVEGCDMGSFNFLTSSSNSVIHGWVTGAAAGKAVTGSPSGTIDWDLWLAGGIEAWEETGKRLRKLTTTGDVVVEKNCRVKDQLRLEGGYIRGAERAAPTAPIANEGNVWFRDVEGKTELVVQFNTGAVIVIAKQP